MGACPHGAAAECVARAGTDECPPGCGGSMGSQAWRLGGIVVPESRQMVEAFAKSHRYDQVGELHDHASHHLVFHCSQGHDARGVKVGGIVHLVGED